MYGFESGNITHYASGNSVNAVLATPPTGFGSGSYALHVTPSAGQGYLNEDTTQSINALPTWSARNDFAVGFRLWVVTRPAAEQEIAASWHPTTSLGMSVTLDQNGVLRYYCLGGGNSSAAVGPTLTNATEYWVTLTNNTASTTWTGGLWVDGTSYGTSTSTGRVADTTSSFVFGTTGTATYDIWFDDAVIYDSASAPLDKQTILGYNVAANGTHNLDASTSAYFNKMVSSVSTPLTTSETTSYQAINPMPIGSGTNYIYINSTLTTANSYYAEYQYARESTHTGTPTAVQALVIRDASNTTSSTWIAKLYDGTNVEDIYNGAFALSVKKPFKKVFTQRPNSGGAWSLSALNNTTVRFGYTNSTADLPRLDGSMIEAIWTTATIDSPGTHFVRYRIGKNVSTGTLNFTVNLVQGTTVIATWSHPNVAQGFTSYEQNLTSAQIAAISDFTNLRLRFVTS